MNKTKHTQNKTTTATTTKKKNKTKQQQQQNKTKQNKNKNKNKTKQNKKKNRMGRFDQDVPPAIRLTRNVTLKYFQASDSFSINLDTMDNLIQLKP